MDRQRLLECGSEGELSKIVIFAKQKSKDFRGTKIAIGDGVVNTQ